MALRFHKASVPFAIVFASIYFYRIVTKAKAAEEAEKPKVEIKFKPTQCSEQLSEGDVVHIHYTTFGLKGTDKLDTSKENPKPFVFKHGSKCETEGKPDCLEGMHEALLGMCVGEKRKITFLPEMRPRTAPGGGRNSKRKRGRPHTDPRGRDTAAASAGPSGFPAKADKREGLMVLVELMDLN
jgi:hypothetical protein